MAEEKQKAAPFNKTEWITKWLFEEGYIIALLIFIAVIILIAAIFNASGYYSAKQALEACMAAFENTDKCAVMLAYLKG